MYNILVCDDEKDIVAALKIYLTAEGYQVLEAGTGREALDILDRERVDLVLMDIMMPRMNGLEAARLIRSTKGRPDLKTLPILAMSANAFDDDVKKSLESGMNDHLSKPIEMEKLITALRRVLK